MCQYEVSKSTLCLQYSLHIQQTALFTQTVMFSTPHYNNSSMMTMMLIHTDNSARSCGAWYGGCTARSSRPRCHDDVLSSRSARHALWHCGHDFGRSCPGARRTRGRNNNCLFACSRLCHSSARLGHRSASRAQHTARKTSDDCCSTRQCLEHTHGRTRFTHNAKQ